MGTLTLRCHSHRAESASPVSFTPRSLPPRLTPRSLNKYKFLGEIETEFENICRSLCSKISFEPRYARRKKLFYINGQRFIDAKSVYKCFKKTSSVSNLSLCLLTVSHTSVSLNKINIQQYIFCVNSLQLFLIGNMELGSMQ